MVATKTKRVPPSKQPRPPRRITPRRAKKNPKHQPTIPIEGSKPGSNLGHVDRLNAYCKRAHELKMLDWTHKEIAEKMCEEFQMVREPSIVTIANWLDKANFAFSLDIAKLAQQLRIEQFNELEKMKAKWLPLATANSLEITRWIRVEGSQQPAMDEDAVKEQIDATKAVVLIMARQAKLLGLDIEKKLEDDKDKVDLNKLQMWIIGQVNQSPEIEDSTALALTDVAVPVASVPAAAKPVTGKVLEMRSGRREIDEMEGVGGI